MEQINNTNVKVKAKTKSKKILVNNIIKTLSDLKNDFLELKMCTNKEINIYE